MTALFVLLGFGSVLALIRAAGWSHRRRSDMGYVSQQWVSEHRSSQTQDSRR